MTNYRKKLIEVALPLEAINKASAREKSIRHGHPSTLHLWWARRPLAAARAVIFAQMVDDPSSMPDLFPTEAKQQKERERQRERERATRRVAEVQAELEALEADLGRIDAALFEVGGDYAKARALADERTAAEQRQDALFSEWEALEARLAED